ncbi:universal stress protein [Oceanidesulfovibrio indonesiensis]|uniref:Universal stress protein n=1 Tax=Oceanidesulfovibrio indonesiensis TaxID=54767 RepID=A0A7M3MJ34_9BACT|nr:universal stress protein [Oceanidesulfovibrio indonesiensis]TVM19477.1 universal stress protein [Oceanidesulfovibrio indonesiensis]
MDSKHVMIAVDGSDNSMRAVEYTAAILGSHDGFMVRLVHIERLPDRDIFADEAAWKASCEEYAENMRSFLADSHKKLVDSGLPEDAVTELYVPSCNRPTPAKDAIRCSQGASISQEILRTVEDGGYGTIVLGRRGLSKAEEFLFGSVSSKIVHHVRGCTVWVVS